MMEEFSFLCGDATTIMIFLWKKHHSLAREEERDDGGKGIHNLFCLHAFSTERREKLSVAIKGEGFLSGILFKYNFSLNAKDKVLVSFMGLNMVLLSQYFWTLFFFFPI